MRQFPASRMTINKIAALMVGVCLASPIAAFAQEATATEETAASTAATDAGSSSTMDTQTSTSAKPFDREAYLQGLRDALKASPDPTQQAPQEAAKPAPYLGSANDKNSHRYKVDQLAKEARQQRTFKKSTFTEANIVNETTPPPNVDSLQHVHETLGATPASIADDPISGELSKDLRREAQKEAALSYGARGGLAKHNFEIMERMKGFDPVLDQVFNFRQLLIKAPSGMLIEPPIVKESTNALVITEGGNEAAVAKEIFDINKQAKIVSAPRDWRQYILQPWSSQVPPPPRVLWPKDAEEQANWNTWVAQGWEAGYEQAEQIFETNTNRLVADYNGMVRYKMLLAQNMISAPYAMHEDRGVTGDKKQMRVGDRALRITGPSQFLTGAELWKPADR